MGAPLRLPQRRASFCQATALSARYREVLRDLGREGISVMKKVLFGSVCAIALAVQPALAQDWAADAGADYGNLAGSTFWDVNGAAMIPLNWGDTGIEPVVGYGGASVFHDLDAGGNFVWN